MKNETFIAGMLHVSEILGLNVRNTIPGHGSPNP